MQSTSKRLYDALRAIENLNYKLDMGKLEDQVMIADARDAMDEYEGLEPHVPRAVLYVALRGGERERFVTAIHDDRVDWSDDIDEAEAFVTTRGIQSARDRVTCRCHGVVPEVRFI